MKMKGNLALIVSLTLTLIGTTLTMVQQARAGSAVPPSRPKGPCLRLGVVLFLFAYSIIFPNEDIGNVLLALKGRHVQTKPA